MAPFSTAASSALQPARPGAAADAQASKHEY